MNGLILAACFTSTMLHVPDVPWMFNFSKASVFVYLCTSKYMSVFIYMGVFMCIAMCLLCVLFHSCM